MDGSTCKSHSCNSKQFIFCCHFSWTGCIRVCLSFSSDSREDIGLLELMKNDELSDIYCQDAHPNPLYWMESHVLILIGLNEQLDEVKR